MPPRVETIEGGREGNGSSEKAVVGQEFEEHAALRKGVTTVARTATELMLSFKGAIEDRGIENGHEESSLDFLARGYIERLLDEQFPDIYGPRFYEVQPVERRSLNAGDGRRYAVVVDAIDGATNAKRAMANRLDSGEVARPQSATCIAICNYEDRNVGAVVSSAVHTYDTRITYSAQAIGDHYQAFREKTELDPGELNKVRGDSATRIIVAGYSNSRRMELGQWGQQLWDNAGVRVYDGCRSSTMDIIGMIEGANDAYVDPRALWPDSGAMLQAYDITAVIPIAKGCGFVVSDVYGNPIENYAFDSNIPLVVSRTPELHGKILEAIKPLLEAQALAKS